MAGRVETQITNRRKIVLQPVLVWMSLPLLLLLLKHSEFIDDDARQFLVSLQPCSEQSPNLTAKLRVL